MYGLTFSAKYVSDHFTPFAILVSPVQLINSTSCIQFPIYYFSGLSFQVRVPACVQFTDNAGLLLKVDDQSLGKTWHNVWLPLAVVSDCYVQLQFEVIFDSDYSKDLSAAIDGITVHNGGCLGLYLDQFEKLL